MSDKSGIEWTDATWNPVTGCTKVSAGCKHCYAKYQAWPRLAAMPNTVYTGREFEQVQLHPERLDQPFRWTKPRMIFVNSMSDLFHEDVPDEFIDKVFAVMALAKQHTFQILTKRPERMLRYLSAINRENHVKGIIWMMLGKMPKRSSAAMKSPWPLPNAWLGVSVEDQAAADARIPLLLQTPAAVRWISAEPLLGPVDLPGLFYYGTERTGGVVPLRDRGHTQLDWVVVGGESGPKARPMHPDWPRSLRDQCAVAGVPFLFKQWGEFVSEGHATGDTNFCYDNSRIGGWVSPNGAYELGADAQPRHDKSEHIFRIGKKLAGRLLDGLQHDGYPEKTTGAPA